MHADLQKVCQAAAERSYFERLHLQRLELESCSGLTLLLLENQKTHQTILQTFFITRLPACSLYSPYMIEHRPRNFKRCMFILMAH